jgi:hypothetical protein
MTCGWPGTVFSHSICTKDLEALGVETLDFNKRIQESLVGMTFRNPPGPLPADLEMTREGNQADGLLKIAPTGHPYPGSCGSTNVLIVL